MVDYKGKNELVQFTIIIEVNRRLQGISTAKLCKNIVSANQYKSYLQGEVSPTREIAAELLNRLGLFYVTDEILLDKTQDMIVWFIEEHMFNEFDQALWRYTVIEANEENLLVSPLVVEFLIIKMAYYAIHDREIYAKTLKILKEIRPLMTREQIFLYNLYLGIDAFKIQGDIDKANEYFNKTKEHGGHPHIYTWLGISDLFNNCVIKAMTMFEKARRRYINDGNLTGLIFASELYGLTYYRENDYESGIQVLKAALKHAKTISRDHLITNFRNQIAWGYYRLKEYGLALEYLERDRYNNDYTVNSSVTKFLIGFELGDLNIINDVREELENRNKTLHRMLYTIVSKDDFVDSDTNFKIDEDDLKSMIELAKITHFELEKAFKSLLFNHYMKTAEYKKLAEYFSEEINGKI